MKTAANNAVLRASLADFRSVNAGALVLVVLNKVDSSAASLLEGDGGVETIIRRMMTAEDIDTTHEHYGTTPSSPMNGKSRADGDASSTVPSLEEAEDAPSSVVVNSYPASGGDFKSPGGGEPHVEILRASALTGQGLDAILDWITR